MNDLDIQQLQSLLEERFSIVPIDNCSPVGFDVDSKEIFEICQFLNTSDRTYFDYLSSLSGVDYGVDSGEMAVVYHLYSIPNDFQLTLRVKLARDMPTVPSVSDIWRSADWHEREAYDLFGIIFENHPDQRRILLPADWEGHPLRKDYEHQEKYHGITVKY